MLDLVPTAPRLGGEMAVHLHRRIGELQAFADNSLLLDSTEASCTSNVEQILNLLGGGVDPHELVVPEPALEYAQNLVHRRIPLSVLLRAYHLGHAFFWSNVLSPGLTASVADEDARSTAIEACSNFMFEYIDHITEELVAAYHVERDRWVRTAAAVRAETARRIVDGDLRDERGACDRLGYELRRTHVGMILACEQRTDGSGHARSLEREAIETASILGCADPLLVPVGDVLWAWCGTFKAPAANALTRLEAHRPSEGVRIAFGRPAHGIEGFRITHLEAGHAARFWSLGNAHGGGTTSYRAIEVISLLASDLDRARRFVLTELGPLAEGSEAAGRMRSTLLGFLAHGCSHVRAAQVMHMHQNTVYNRVRRAEELLGRPVAERRVELQTALMLAETLGTEVLGEQ